jgi:hypothetical protein
MRDNCYTIKTKQEYVSPYQLWDNKKGKDFESICTERAQKVD